MPDAIQTLSKGARKHCIGMVIVEGDDSYLLQTRTVQNSTPGWWQPQPVR